MQSALKALQHAIDDHEQWSERLFATLICRLAPDQRDLDHGAHRLCAFGRWYYGAGAQALADRPGFVRIGQAHERMHFCASALLRTSLAGAAVSPADYERLVDAMHRMRNDVAILKRELDDPLHDRDPLTGASNRNGMLTKLVEEQARVARNSHACTIVMMDVDHFKAVNDSYGHVAGDKVLVEIVRHLMVHLRPYDRVFRYGGEEFLLCLPDANQDVSRDAIERIRIGLEAMTHQENGRTFRVSVSFGLTELVPETAVEISIKRADEALYSAKSSGRNRTVVWDPSMTNFMTRASVA